MKKEAAPNIVSKEYLEILKEESTRAWTSCQKLNADKEMSKTAQSLAKDDSRSVEYKSEFLLLRDVVKVFNDYAAVRGDQKQVPVKAKFILVYLYERFQGKDLSQTYDLHKINELAASPRLDENVRIIVQVPFFHAVEEMKDEFILPAVLLRNKSDQLPGITAFMNRIATLMVKSETAISKPEEDLLKHISEKASNPKPAVNRASYNGIPPNDTLEIALKELHELIGLEDIKKHVDDLTNFLKVQKMRKETGLKTSNNSLHSVFTGPPGTGKTTVARILGRIFKHLGYLEKGHLIETDRAGMVAGYVGQTAIKTDEIVKSAAGGVLFIDEAYSLNPGGLNDYGSEVIEILLKRMEDMRDDLVVIVAGYPDEMREFIQSNPGLESRFSRYFEFDHFTVDALLKIFKLNVQKADFVLTTGAEEKLLEIIERIHEKRHKSFGNARTMRNLFEKITERQANRVVSITPINREVLVTLTEEDVPEILPTVKEIIRYEDK